MAKRPSRPQPTWSDLKAKLASFDRPGLLGLIQDLYAANKENQTFLHARFAVGDDVLQPYKQAVEHWLWPDVLRNQDTSVVKAKQAISNYKKAVGDPAGLAELMVFFCERAAGFCHEFGNDDASYFAALVRMFEQALTILNTLPPADGDPLLARLNQVCDIGQEFGYGVGDDMAFLFAEYS
ncbi:MAG: hypothetical protein M3Y72_04440 [Acidobacteriota bacterium]|nr:hypothetical protein [Acidobacteriota bacterium]